jgi:M6 family metalloprotease-like protein
MRKPSLAALLPLLAVALAAFVRVPPPADTVSGWVQVLWRSPRVPGAGPDVVAVYLVDERGRATPLTIPPAEAAPLGGLPRLNGRRVTVTGERAGTGARSPLRVRSIRAEAGPRLSAAAAAQPGAHAFVTLLCRFPDGPAADPHPLDTYRQWMGAAYPGIDHFWREVSGGAITLAGSVVRGPWTLPRPKAWYFPDGAISHERLASDCLAAADPEVDFTAFTGIHMQFNLDLDGWSWGGGWNTTLDGATRRWGMTWMSNWATPFTYAHETGHTLGLPHSSGSYGKVYDSRWDVMSGGGAVDPAVGEWVGVHTIGWYKDVLGLIPASRKHVAAPGTSVELVLERGALPGAGGTLLAVLPITGGASFYTAEARRAVGYDGRLPAEGVVVHRVTPGENVPARVVDTDGNGNPNDGGAVLVPGEEFYDDAAGASVRVLAQTESGFRVRVSLLDALVLDPAASERPAGVMGAPYRAALPAPASAGAVAWTVVGGALPPGVALDAATGELSGVPERVGRFTFTAAARGDVARGRGDFSVEVTRPALAEGAVFDAVLGGPATLTADQARYLDLAGNRNGRLDLGDVRAWLEAQGSLPASASRAPSRERS